MTHGFFHLGREPLVVGTDEEVVVRLHRDVRVPAAVLYTILAAALFRSATGGHTIALLAMEVSILGLLALVMSPHVYLTNERIIWNGRLLNLSWRINEFSHASVRRLFGLSRLVLHRATGDAVSLWLVHPTPQQFAMLADALNDELE